MNKHCCCTENIKLKNAKSRSVIAFVVFFFGGGHGQELPTAFLLDSKLLLQLPPSSSDSSSGRCTTKISWIALVDCDNNAWEVICRRGQKQHQNRLLLSPAGWARFARDHFLEEGDECIFELLLQQQQEEHNKTDNSSSFSVVLATFRVHIFRVLEIQNLSSKATTGSNPSSKD